MTTVTLTLTEFLLVRIAEDEVWANEAGRHDNEPLVEGGEHWRWECTDDEVVNPNTDVEYMECSHEHFAMSLRSVEQYPYRSFAGEGPSIHLSTDSELTPTVAGHIARHDPARVLAECEAKRRIVEEYAERDADVDLMLGPDVTRQRQWSGLHMAVNLLAAVYADHPDYRDEWKP